jgi:hypothetical protein
MKDTGEQTRRIKRWAGDGLAPGLAPKNWAPPVISGSPHPGGTLAVDVGFWTGDESIVYTYEWYVGNSPIAGANGSTYVVPANALGWLISCLVIATNAHGLHSTYSNAVEITAARAFSPGFNGGFV